MFHCHLVNQWNTHVRDWFTATSCKITLSDAKAMNEDIQKAGCDFFQQNSSLTFVWKHHDKPQMNLLRVVSFSQHIQSRYLPSNKNYTPNSFISVTNQFP